MAADQATIKQQLVDQHELLERRFQEADVYLDMCFQEADVAMEHRIVDSELRLDSRFTIIEQAATDLGAWS